jgi:hypothetical protein
MFEFLFPIVNVARPPIGLTARSRQMIPSADENKYCFDMQVSARAMGSRDRSRAHPRHQIGAAGFVLYLTRDYADRLPSPVEMSPIRDIAVGLPSAIKELHRPSVTHDLQELSSGPCEKRGTMDDTGRSRQGSYAIPPAPIFR